MSLYHTFPDEKVRMMITNLGFALPPSLSSRGCPTLFQNKILAPLPGIQTLSSVTWCFAMAFDFFSGYSRPLAIPSAWKTLTLVVHLLKPLQSFEGLKCHSTHRL